MELTEILSDLRSPHWWFGVVFVGIIITVVGHYFVKIFDSRLKATFSWWENRQKASDLKYRADLDLLLSDPQQEKILLSIETRARLKVIDSMISIGFAFFLFLILYLIFDLKWLSFVVMIYLIIHWIIHQYFSGLASRSERLLEDYYSLSKKDSGNGKEGVLPKGK